MLDLHVDLLHLGLAPLESLYRTALAPLGLHVSLRACVEGEGGSAYEAWAAKLRQRHGRASDGIRERLAPVDGRTPTRRLWWSWSAGYGGVRHVLREEGGLPDWCCGYVASDSVYASDDDPRIDTGTPDAAQLAPFVALAREAMAGRKVFVLAAGDVPTGYASTAQCARAIAAAVGLELVEAPTPAPDAPYPRLRAEGRAGLLVVRIYDARPKRGSAEHLAFGRELGAELLALGAELALLAPPAGCGLPVAPPPRSEAPTRPELELRVGDRAALGTPIGDAIAAVQRRVGATADGWWGPRTSIAVHAWQRDHGLPERDAWGEPERARAAAADGDTEPPPPSTERQATWGPSILAEGLRDLENGVREQPSGSNWGPEVGQYLRDVGMPAPGSWCAAGLSAWIARAAEVLHREPLPRSRGAKALGAALAAVPGARRLSAAAVRGGAPLPAGAVLVWHRGAPDAWTGHVGVVETDFAATATDRVCATVEANSGPRGDAVARMRRNVDDRELLYAVVLPA